MQVFVSHAHADNELCDRYVAALRERGLDVWYDRTNMQGGHFLDEQISRELVTRMAFVLMVTPASLASYWVRLEVGAFQSLAAKDTSRLFLPVRMAECEMPLLMMGIKWIDAVSDGFDAAVGAMAVALDAPATAEPTESVEGLLAQGKAAPSRPERPLTASSPLCVSLLSFKCTDVPLAAILAVGGVTLEGLRYRGRTPR